MPLASVALGGVILRVAWRAAEDLRAGPWFLGIMTFYALVLRFGVNGISLTGRELCVILRGR